MVLSDLFDVAVPLAQIQIEADARQLFCGSCRALTDAVEVSNSGYCCPSCKSPICVMCGCSENQACVGGCYWMSPGICSSHRGELQQLARRVFSGAAI